MADARENVPQPNKPGGAAAADKPREAGERQAVKNQASVTPDDYPASIGGKPNYKDRDKA